MAWGPRKRTRRNSRRDRNLALLARSLLGLLLLMCASLLVLSRLSPGRFDALRGASADLVAPVWGTLGRPFIWAGEAIDYLSSYYDAADRVRQLGERERVYRQSRARYWQAEAENRELKRLLGVIEPSRERVGIFAITGSSGGSYLREAVIAGGIGDGIRPGQPVIGAEGLVGRTISVGQNAARVMLVNDVSSRVPVRVARTGLPAMLIGTNEPLVDVALSGPTTNVVEIGDQLVTSGDGGLFPPGVPVATVVRALGDTPRAIPTALPTGLGYVVVVQPYLPPPDEKESVLDAVDASVAALPGVAEAETAEVVAASEGQEGAPAP